MKDAAINVFGLVGLACVGVGMWLVDPVYALVTVGALLICGAVIGSATR